MAETERLYNSVAPLRNVAALVALIDQAKNRSLGLPGLATFYGPSGYGKTTAAVYAANKYDAYQVQMKSVWTGKSLCEALVKEMGLEPAKTIAKMVDQISQQLAISDGVLIIDEADYLCKNSLIEVVRDMYESSMAPIILIGEEKLPQKLMKWERVHGRMLEWTAAQPAALSDIDHLAKIYCPNLTLDDEFKSHLLKSSGGSIRRVCVNLERVQIHARTNDIELIDMETWGKKSFFRTDAPRPRRELA